MVTHKFGYILGYALCSGQVMLASDLEFSQ